MTEDYKFTDDWFSVNIPNWEYLRNLEYSDYKTLPIKALEVGCFQGQATTWLLNNLLIHDKSSIDVIDTFEGSVDHSEIQKNSIFEIFLNNIKLTNSERKVNIRKGYSHDQLIILNISKRNYFDFIYIDADHRGFNVLRDAILAFPLLKVGGCIVFDDYQWESGSYKEVDRPKEAIDHFVAQFQDCLSLLFSGYQVFYKKIADK